MRTMYEASSMSSGGCIKTVEVERETDQSVWINGRRSARLSNWKAYFDTYDEAKAHIMQCHTEVVERAQSRLDYAQECMAKAEKL